MPESHGADVRQSPYVSRLAGIEPEGVHALALAALALLDAINAGKLVATDTDTRALVEALYPLQDALHGPEGRLPAALAGFLSTAEPKGVHRSYPMRVSDAASMLKACSESFGWLAAILGAIGKNPDCGGEVRRLAGAGRSIADDMEDLAEVWSEDMKTGGVQA